MDGPVRTLTPPPLSLQDAKAHFSEVVAAAMSGRAQHVMRRGKPAVVIVAAAEYERMASAERPQTTGFIDYLRSMPKTLPGEDDPFEPARRARVRPRDIDLTP